MKSRKRLRIAVTGQPKHPLSEHSYERSSTQGAPCTGIPTSSASISYSNKTAAFCWGSGPPTAAYAADTWHLFAGHLEEESALACAVREAAEELDVGVREDDLELTHVVHHFDREDGTARRQLLFRVHAWQGTPRINELDRCSELGWFSPALLPTPLVDYTRVAFDGISRSLAFSTVGWRPTAPVQQRPAPG